VRQKKSANPVLVAEKLSRWFKKNARTLPWRENPEPYYVWLSEVMLQQTQVTAVIPYFNKFVMQFPSVGKLAGANLDQVYSLWAGLGYYSRARNLHRGAMAIQERITNNIGFPESRNDWLLIPGVGEYTAGAICSIALNQREAIVDGNVVRVLSRVFAEGKIDSKKTEIWNRAREVVAVKKVEPRVVNQALMELGALICKPKNPKCGDCPIEKECLGKNKTNLYPPPKPKKIWKRVQEERWVLLSGKKVFLVQNTNTQWRSGLWDFPIHNSIPISKAKLIKEEVSRYVVTNHKIERMHVVYEVSGEVAAKITSKGKWFAKDELPAVPAPVKKFLVSL
jgi:A/G-specific adenine glycosylase